MSNTWVIYLVVGDNTLKRVLIPHNSASAGKGASVSPLDELASHQLVGRVKAYQGNDG